MRRLSSRRHATNWGFHWDTDLIAASVREYSRNEILVWLESDLESHPFYRLASDVLVHALHPEAIQLPEDEAKRGITDVLANVNDAMNIIIEFFAACTCGYLRFCGATRREAS